MFSMPREACDCHSVSQELSLSARWASAPPPCEDTGQMTLLPGLPVFPSSWDCPRPLTIPFHSAPRPSLGRKHWGESWFWVQQRLVIPGCAMGPLRLATGQARHWRNCAAVETWWPPYPPQSVQGPLGCGPVSGEGTLHSTSAPLGWAGWLTAGLPGESSRTARKMRDFQGQLCFLTQS